MTTKEDRRDCPACYTDSPGLLDSLCPRHEDEYQRDVENIRQDEAWLSASHRRMTSPRALFDRFEKWRKEVLA